MLFPAEEVAWVCHEGGGASGRSVVGLLGAGLAGETLKRRVHLLTVGLSVVGHSGRNEQGTYYMWGGVVGYVPACDLQDSLPVCP